MFKCLAQLSAKNERLLRKEKGTRSPYPLRNQRAVGAATSGNRIILAA
jgi:hypothetical protein